MKSKTAFTKKDVIVTMGCVVFLLANLGTIGSSGRRRAKETVCISNLRQWGTVFQMYAQDNNGYFMRGWWSGGASSVFHTDYWMEALRPYYGNEHDLRCCPEATIPGTEIGGSPWGGNGTFTAWGTFTGEVCGEPSSAWAPATACDYGSYGMNGWLCNPPPDAPFFQSHNVARDNWRYANVAGADKIPLLTGNQWLNAWPMQTDLVPEYEGEPWGPYASYSHMVHVCMNRHNGFVNSAFLDYSARKVGLKELWKLKWHRSFDVNDPSPTDWDDPNHWMYGMRDYD